MMSTIPLVDTITPRPEPLQPTPHPEQGARRRTLTYALISFINIVYARPWQEDERALLIPGILGGVIGYAVGVRCQNGKISYWTTLIAGSAGGIILALFYNEILLHMAVKPWWYKFAEYLAIFLMNLATFSAFGAVGWTFSAKNGKDDNAE
jgi:hypothetical protein